MSRATYSGVPAFRARLEQLVTDLRGAASGDVVKRAAVKVESQIQAVSRRFLEAHRASGHAADTATVSHSGGLIQLRRVEYAHFIPGDPFRNGAMPPFVVKNASKIFKAELEAVLKGEPSPLSLADAAAEEALAVKSRAKFKRDTAKIARRLFRESAAGKAAQKVAAAQRRAARKASGASA